MAGTDADLPTSLVSIISRYAAYTTKTLSGSHGPTAAYWMKYVEMIDLRNDLSRSIRCGDFNLYIHSLNQMAAYFFALNHPNYARWTVKLVENLCNINDTHPDLLEYIKKCGFGVKRTNKNFSMSPIDLTLEQTINADAANRMTGVSSFTNSISARQKWAKTHTDRTANITSLYNILGLSRKDDVTRDLKTGEIRRFSENLKDVIREIKTLSNPFATSTGDCSYNLINFCTGKCVSQKTEKFLLNLKVFGVQKRDTFLRECEKDPKRFENAISKTDILNFASEYKVSRKSVSGKVCELKMERNLIGRILFIASQNSVDIKEIFKYPLTPVPQSFGHLDGSIIKTDKSVLLRHLEKKAISIPPNKIDAIILDGFFLLHTLGDIPLTFGNIAMHILKKICRMNANNIHVVFDQIITPSIKDHERDRRNDSDEQLIYNAFTKAQRRPANFVKSLRSNSFKKRLNEFLVEEWNGNEYHHIIGEKDVFVTSNATCFHFKTQNGNVIREEVKELKSFQEEADTRMMLHLSSLPKDISVVIKSSDTDVLIIALYNLPNLKNGIKVWLEVGNLSKNTLRYIDVNSIYHGLGATLCAALPGFHCFTGCDYTPSFFKKGKIKPFRILESCPDFQSTFSEFGNGLNTTDEHFNRIERFVCNMYQTRALNVDEARYEIFFKSCKPTTKKIFKNIRSFEGSLLPPNKSVLLQQLNRCNYICHVWKNAVKNGPLQLSPSDCGWVLKDNMYKVKWFDGNTAPDKLEDILKNEVDASDNEDYGHTRESSDESDSE